MTGSDDDPGRTHMRRLLERLAAECAASTDSRSWTARVGLVGGSVVELGSVDLARLPVVLLRDRRGRATVYTTLRDVVWIELGKSGAPRLEGALGAEADAVERVDVV